MATSSSIPLPNGLISVRLSAIPSTNRSRQNVWASNEEPPSTITTAFAGGAGTVHARGPEVYELDVGDSVMVRLPSTEVQAAQEQERLITLPASMACKSLDQTTPSDVVRMTELFLAAVAMIHNTKRIPLEFLLDGTRTPYPSTILILASEFPITLVTIRLIRNALPHGHIIALYDYEPAATDAEFDIMKPMVCGATYASKPQLTENPASVLESHRKLVRHYSGQDCVDVILDLSGRDEWRELMSSLLCEDGLVAGLEDVMRNNSGIIFEQPGIMKELGRLAQNGELDASELNVRRSE